MAFVFEKTISDADRASFDFDALRKAVYRGWLQPTQWTIDRERNAIFFFVEQSREPPHEKEYALVWNRQVFRSIVLDSESWMPDGTLRLVRKITQLLPPPGSPPDARALKEAETLTKQALHVWARAERERVRIQTSEIFVEIDPEH